MPRAQPLITNFTGGELASELEGRVDLPYYPNGCRTEENFVSRVHGPATFRPGARFKAEIKTSAKRARVMGFEFSEVQAYMLEVGDQAIRFYKDRARIVVADTDAAVTNGDFTANITGWTNHSTGGATIAHDASNGRLSLVGVASQTAWAEQAIAHTKIGQEHVVRFRVLGLAGDSIQLRIGATSTGAELVADRVCEAGWHCVAFTPTASPFYLQFRNVIAKTLQIDDVALIDNAPVEIGSPFLGDDGLFAIRDHQSADVLYLNATIYREMKLTRSGHSTWSLTETEFIDGPYLDQNTDAAKTLQPSATSGYGITITAAGHSPFTPTSIGRLVTIQHGSTWGYAVIAGYTSPTQVTADVGASFGATTAQSAWRLGVWSDDNGWPAAGAIYEERVWRGGARAYPARLDASKTGEFEIYTPGTADDDPIALTISGAKVPAIRWLEAVDALLAGTQSGQYWVRSDRLDGPMTPTAIVARKQSPHGCAAVRPIETASGVMYVQRQGRKLREASYQVERDKFTAPDRTRRARHITKGGIVDLAYQEEPDPLAWAVRADGTLICCTYEVEEQVNAWHRHPIADGGIVESVAVIPGVDQDEVWLIVRRTIDGQTKRYVELLDPFQEEGDAPEDALHLDCAVTLDNTIAAILTPGAGATTLSATDVPFTTDVDAFAAGDVGRFIKYRYDGGKRTLRDQVIEDTAIAEITAHVGAREVKATIRAAFPSVTPIAASTWRMTVTTITAGLSHLEGKAVAVVGDGAVQSGQTIVGGALPNPIKPAATVHVGLAYVGKLHPMRLEGGTQEGPSQGATGRVSSIVVRFARSAEGVKVGRAGDRLEEVIFRRVTDPMDLAVRLFDGDKKVTFPGTYDRDANVLIVQDKPLPCTVVMLKPRFTKNEG